MAPRTKPAEDRRADLLDAAKAVFADKGLAAATVSDVTTAAGVAKGTFYLYFQSKEELVAALRDRFFDGLVDEVEAAVARLPAGDWWGRVDVVVDLATRLPLELMDLHDVVFHSGPGATGDAARAHAEGTERAHARAVALLGDLFRDGTRAGAFDVPDPEMTARLLFSAMHGACDQPHHDPALAGAGARGTAGAEAGRERDLERLVAATRLLFRRALAPADGATVAIMTDGQS